jgi:hypothetical protein
VKSSKITGGLRRGRAIFSALTLAEMMRSRHNVTQSQASVLSPEGGEAAL